MARESNLAKRIRKRIEQEKQDLDQMRARIRELQAHADILQQTIIGLQADLDEAKPRKPKPSVESKSHDESQSTP